jgi:hypothetical protein
MMNFPGVAEVPPCLPETAEFLRSVVRSDGFRSKFSAHVQNTFRIPGEDCEEARIQCTMALSRCEQSIFSYVLSRVTLSTVARDIIRIVRDRIDNQCDDWVRKWQWTHHFLNDCLTLGIHVQREIFLTDDTSLMGVILVHPACTKILRKSARKRIDEVIRNLRKNEVHHGSDFTPFFFGIVMVVVIFAMGASLIVRDITPSCPSLTCAPCPQPTTCTEDIWRALQPARQVVSEFLAYGCAPILAFFAASYFHRLMASS